MNTKSVTLFYAIIILPSLSTLAGLTTGSDLGAVLGIVVGITLVIFTPRPLTISNSITKWGFVWITFWMIMSIFALVIFNAPVVLILATIILLLFFFIQIIRSW